MKTLITNIRNGIIVYKTFMLNKVNELSIEKLKKTPKEALIYFSDIISVSTANMPDNWIQLNTVDGEIYFEDKSMTGLIKIVEENTNLVFQQITKKLTINVNAIRYKSNLSVIELENGDIHEVSRRYKGKLKIALSRVWIE